MINEMQSQTMNGQAFLVHWLIADLPCNALVATLCTGLVAGTAHRDFLDSSDVGVIILLGIGYVAVCTSIHMLALIALSLMRMRDTMFANTVANVIVILLCFIGGLCNGLSYRWDGLSPLFRALGLISPGFWISNSLVIHVLSGKTIDCPDALEGTTLQKTCTGEMMIEYLGLSRFDYLPQYSFVYVMAVTVSMVLLASVILKVLHMRSLRLFWSLGRGEPLEKKWQGPEADDAVGAQRSVCSEDAVGPANTPVGASSVDHSEPSPHGSIEV
jgi:hypothetical protein